VVRRRGLDRFAVIVAATAAALLPALAASPAGAAGGTYVVTTTDGTGDTNVGNGTCRTAAGTCSLRAALQEDQADDGPSTIRFDIPGSGPRTIHLTAALPTLADGGTTVDGYTQPGSARNTAARGSNATLRVEVQGTGAGGPEGFVVTSSGNTIRGLALFGLRLAVRIAGTGATQNAVVGNFIGTNAAATFQSGSLNSSTAGINIRSNAARNRVGGSAAADRNVISGNSGRGVLINVPSEVARGTVENVVEGNVIGLLPNGSGRRANLGHGVDLNAGASRNHIVNNVISGNNGSGVEVSHGATTAANEIGGNRIGTDLTGASSPSHAHNGGTGQPNVRIEDGPVDTFVHGNVIGGSAAGGIRVNALSGPALRTRIEFNRIGVSTTGARIPNGSFGVYVDGGSAGTRLVFNQIAFNGGPGVQVGGANTDRVAITANHIFDNSALGIDLLPGGVTPNDAGDGDDGPNDLQNFHVLEALPPDSVRARTCGSCFVELFLADTDADGAHGEGRSLLAGGRADASGSVTLTVPDRARGQRVTATARVESSGNTSEFSRNIVAPK
jgi:hypothetical protein